VRYGGPDVAAFGMSVDELAALHAGRTYAVKMIGFLPGFAYLGELDPALLRPRRASPRTRVPAGSVAIAGPYTGVYPFDSPGGWHLIGEALDFVAFDQARGATLRLGDEVRFECST
jgi:5-oxoprolinase (ATP-hydrolysing) subunit A